MFSIIDNEINVNFEILGGSNTNPGIGNFNVQTPTANTTTSQTPAQTSIFLN